MSPELELQPESVYFRAELEGILDVQLTPENIDNYADNALTELVDFVQSVQTSFQESTTQSFAHQKELENAAFRHYNLEDIEDILDHVAEKSDELHALDTLIDKVVTEQAVFVPPDPGALIPRSEDSEAYTPPRTTPRLKTLLFVLANEFELDVHDEAAVAITTGMNDSVTLRGESYCLVDAPELERCVLVCDEVGNATFVLDRTAMEEVDITPDDMTTLTKSEIKDLLREYPALGQTLIYHEGVYVKNLIELLSGEPEEVAITQCPPPRYLRSADKAPDDVFSAHGLAKELGVGNKMIARAIKELGDELGEVKRFRFGTKVANGFNTDQQARLREHLEEKGAFADKAPDDVFSAGGLAKEWNVGHRVIVNAIKELGDELGEIELFRFGTRVSEGLNAYQQAKLCEYFEEKGMFSDKAPDDVFSIGGLAKEWNVGYKAIANAIKELGDELGEVKRFRFGKQVADGFNTDQQAKLREHIEEKDK